MLNHSDTKLRSLKLNRRNSVIFAVLMLSLTAIAMPTAAEIVDPAEKYDGEPLQLLTFFLFFVGYISMGAAFVFFMSERSNVAPEYRTTMTISALIVGIAAFHYYYMRGVYTDLGVVSVEYRYMDWIITVPLMALKFPSLVGKDAITDAKFAGLGFTGICFTGALIMIGFGYAGEAGLMNGYLGLILGGVGWAMIIVATGTPWSSGLGVDNSKIKHLSSSGAQTHSAGSSSSDGSSIHSRLPLQPTSQKFLMEIDNGAAYMAVAYNIADIINKIGFGVVAWMGAKKATEAMNCLIE